MDARNVILLVSNNSRPTRYQIETTKQIIAAILQSERDRLQRTNAALIEALRETLAGLRINALMHGVPEAAIDSAEFIIRARAALKLAEDQK